MPLLTGLHRAHHGEILRNAGKLAEQNQLKPLLADRRFGLDEIAEAYDMVAKGSKGKVVVEH
jgi:NADPH:quinone reductase-like Zn-dependent oxidoreductase